MPTRTSNGAEPLLEAREAYRKANLRAIRRLLRRLSRPKHFRDRIDAETCSRLRISITRLPFDSDEIDFGVRFSKPVEKDRFDALFTDFFVTQGKRLCLPPFSQNEDDNRTYNMYLHWSKLIEHAMLYTDDYDHEKHMWVGNPQFLDYSDWHRTKTAFFGERQEQIGESDRGWEWGTAGVYAVTPEVEPTPNESYHDKAPHVACVVTHTIPMGPECIPRGELISILWMIKQRLRYEGWNSHAIIPVFVYSFNDNEARITQAYFDGKTLHLRQTDPILLNRDTMPKIKALFSWVMAEPLGDTLFHESGMSIDGDRHQASGSPPTPGKVAISNDPHRDSTLLRAVKELVICS